MWLQKRFLPHTPGVLLVCVAGIAVSAVLGFQALGGDVVGMVPAGLPTLGWPEPLTIEQHRALLPPAMIIALISFTEAMASARSLPSPDGRLWDQNQELVGQGLAKMASGFSGAFPVSGSFSRTALNRYLGATSGWSALFAATCALFGLLFFTQYLQYLPKAILAAIIIVPVFGLLAPSAFVRLWRASPDDGLVGLTTFAVTLASAPYLHWGVLTGFLLSILFFLYRRSHPRLIELGLHAAGTLRDRALHGLEDGLLVGGGATLSGAYAAIVGDVGNRTNIVQANLSAQQGLTEQLEAVQQSESGVNLDEEAANLIRYQQFYQANAKVIQTGSTIMDAILGLR